MHYLYSLVLLLIVSVPVQAQNALHFDGSGDVVQSNYDGPLGTSSRTFEAWVYVDPSAPASNLCILDYGSNAVGSRNTFNISGSRALSYISGGTNANISSSPNDVPVGQWTHVAFTFDNGTGFFFVNGVQVGTGNLSTVNTPSGGADVKIGERVTGGSIPFYGIIDEVKIWDIARTGPEILASYNDEVCNADPNLELYYRFNEGVANGTNIGVTLATDDSGNGYNGVLSGFALTGNTSNWTNGVALTPGITSTTVQDDACETYTWSVNGQTYTSSGIYSEVLTGATGCDSIVNLDLSIYSANDLTTNQVVCDSFFWGVNNTTYYATTTVAENLTTSQGCPYQHTLNVTVNNSFDTVVLVYDECPPYVWGVNGVSYDTSGTYFAQYTTTQGCDSNYQLNLVIYDDAVADITQNGDGSLSTSWTFDIQWVDCATNTPIAGATGSNFVPTANGDYAVIAYGPNWCPDTSACFTVDYLNLETQAWNNVNVTVEPNPTTGLMMVTFPEIIETAEVQILDAKGRILLTKEVKGSSAIDLELVAAPGVYYLKSITEQGISTNRVVLY